MISFHFGGELDLDRLLIKVSSVLGKCCEWDQRDFFLDFSKMRILSVS